MSQQVGRFKPGEFDSVGQDRPVIALINPPHILEKGQPPTVVFEPIGLAYIAAVLEREKYNVSVIDALGLGWDKNTRFDSSREIIGLTFEEIAERIRDISPQIVGVAAPFTKQAESAFLAASAVKKVDSSITTIMGGCHATTYSLQCLSHPDVDLIVTGEGEIQVLKLIKALETGALEGLGEIRGIGFKKDGTPVINDRETYNDDLDSLPFPARHLLPMENYFKAVRSLRGNLDNYNRNRSATVITSRGCPYSCIFCSGHLIMGRKWRARSPENVVAEVQELAKKFGVKFINFQDDNLTLNKKRMSRLCDLLMERKTGIKWDTPNGVRADTLDEELLLKMKASGCTEICIAPESGNQYVVDHVFKKRMDLKKIEEVTRICKRIGLRICRAIFLIGLPGETKETIRDSVNFAHKLRKLGASRVHFNIATPFEGTELYDVVKKMGYLKEAGEGNIHLEAPRIETPEFTCTDIDQFHREGMKANAIIPFGRLRLALRFMLTDPVQFMKLSFRYLTERQ